MTSKTETPKGEETSAPTNTRIGVFGGTFNPLHVGHIQCVRMVKSRLGIDKIHVVPAAQNPRKPRTEGPKDDDRLEMCRVGFASDADYVVVDDRELKRGGLSYTVTTLESFAKDYDPSQLHLIIGMDQFEELDRWHRVDRIFELASIIVVSRPGHSIPHNISDFPEGLRPLLADFEKGFGTLTSGRHIEFLRMPDADVAANDIRKRLRTGRSVDKYLTIEVEEFIRSRNLYGPIGPRIGDFEQFTKFCAEALYAKKGINVKGFDLRPTTAPTEFSLVASGTSTRHTASLAESVLSAVKEEFNVFPQSVEGMGEGRWVLLDYGSLIVHIFYDFVRQEYRLEDLWQEARPLDIKDSLAP